MHGYFSGSLTVIFTETRTKIYPLYLLMDTNLYQDIRKYCGGRLPYSYEVFTWCSEVDHVMSVV